MLHIYVNKYINLENAITENADKVKTGVNEQYWWYVKWQFCKINLSDVDKDEQV